MTSQIETPVAPVIPQTVEDEKVDTPKQYSVLIHNDDHTPFDVVVDVLNTVFSHPRPRAVAIMMAAHTTGKALVATMSKDMAETKALQAMDLAGRSINPVTRQPCFLQFSTEEA